MKTIVSVLAVALIFSGCAASNRPPRYSAESSVSRALSALDRASESVAFIEASLLLAETPTKQVEVRSILRMAREYQKTAERASKRAFDSMVRAQAAETKRAGVENWYTRTLFDTQIDQARASAQRASDDAVAAARRAEVLANRFLAFPP